MKIGYARVSTDDQHCENQIQELLKAGCDRRHIYQDKASGGTWERPQLHKALDHLREGDVFIVWKLDRLSRSLSDLLLLLDRIKKAGAGFKSLTEAIDTTTAGGELIMHVLGAFAQFERSIIKERTMLGLARARANGKIGGSRPKLDKDQEAEIVRMVASGDKTQVEAGKLFHVSKATVSRIMQRQADKKKTKLLNAA
jgi:DNA invertase Pin-like site-specific DNA recombinase